MQFATQNRAPRPAPTTLAESVTRQREALANLLR